MSRKVTLEVSRKQFATITVEVPDDVSDEQLIMWNFRKPIADFVDKKDAQLEWEIDYDSTEVEEIVGPEFGFDYEYADIAAELQSIKDEMKRQEESFKGSYAEFYQQ